MSIRELALSEEQQELSELLDGLLSKHSASAAVRAAAESAGGYDPGLWALLCEQVGVAALPIPEEYDGAGFGLTETMVVLERLGFWLTPSPLLAGTLATTALLSAGDPGACARLLPAIATGRSATLAWSGPAGLSGGPEPVIWRDGALHGEVTLVLDGDTAEILLVAAQDEATPGRVVLVEVDPDAPGLRRVHTPAVDLTLRLARLELEATPGRLVGADAAAALGQAHVTACVATAALSVGTAQRGLDMTVAYSKERVQFGRPIGSFQALKHRMADMLVAVETSRSAALEATLALASGDPDGARRASVAKAWCGEALEQVAAETVQLHGGIAITWEHDAHLVLKRARSLGQLFGAPHRHRGAVLAG